MATLSVLKFDDPRAAARTLIALQGMQDRNMITLEDAAVVSWPEGNKKPSIPQEHLVGEMALGGAFWDFLFGLSSSCLSSARQSARGRAPRYRLHWRTRASTQSSSSGWARRSRRQPRRCSR
jgi:hypothetical protein